jgi:acyl-CoA thioester hydrolase
MFDIDPKVYHVNAPSVSCDPMNRTNETEAALARIEMPIRVRYPEADPMGYLHHSVYPQYFEMGRIELLRKLGHSYADLEREGVFFVVTKLEIRYRQPARFDDQLTLITKLVKQTSVRFDHAYQLIRDGLKLAEGQTTIACVDRKGEVRPIPDHILAPAQT